MYKTGKVLKFYPFDTSAGKEMYIDPDGHYFVKVFAYCQSNTNIVRLIAKNIPCATESDAEAIYNDISSIADVKTYLESCKS